MILEFFEVWGAELGLNFGEMLGLVGHLVSKVHFLVFQEIEILQSIPWLFRKTEILQSTPWFFRKLDF